MHWTNVCTFVRTIKRNSYRLSISENFGRINDFVRFHWMANWMANWLLNWKKKTYFIFESELLLLFIAIRKYSVNSNDNNWFCFFTSRIQDTQRFQGIRSGARINFGVHQYDKSKFCQNIRYWKYWAWTCLLWHLIFYLLSMFCRAHFFHLLHLFAVVTCHHIPISHTASGIRLQNKLWCNQNKSRL